MPQGAAGPERGVETPNLMTSAASAPGLDPSNTAARSPTSVNGVDCFIVVPSCAPATTSGATIGDAERPCQSHGPVARPRRTAPSHGPGYLNEERKVLR